MDKTGLHFRTIFLSKKCNKSRVTDTQAPKLSGSGPSIRHVRRGGGGGTQGRPLPGTTTEKNVVAPAGPSTTQYEN